MRKLLVARLVGAIVRLFGSRLFGLALTAVLGLIRIVVGVGIVVVLHRPHNRDSQPRNPPTLDPTPPRVQFAFQPAAQRLSSTRRAWQPATTSLVDSELDHAGATTLTLAKK